MPLSSRDCWIFDMDGTLTVAAHDFDGIRLELGLPVGQPILEAIAARPLREAEELHRRLDEIEEEIAQRSRPQPGAADVLAWLQGRGVRLGILTRNSEPIARTTLEASGLGEFFLQRDIVGRESSAPKPRPDGIFELLRRWEATPVRGVMVGDSRFDVEAGRRAGTLTVFFDVSADDVEPCVDRERFAEADHRIESLRALLALCGAR